MLKSSRFWIVVLVTGLLLLSFSPRNFLADELTTDPASYQSHAFTLALDFDLDYSNEPLMCLNARTLVPCHPVGSGLFAAPVVLVFSLLDRLADAPVLLDHWKFQYSWSFFGYSLSHSLYFFAGLWLFALALVRMGLGIARWRVLLYSASFGMAYYSFQSVQMSHVYQFFALALAFWAAAGMWQAFDRGRSSLPHTVLAAVAAILTIAIRPADVIVLLLPGIVVFTLWALRHGGDRKMVGGIMRLAGSYGAWVGVAFIPLGWFNWRMYGAVFPTPNEMYGTTHKPVPRPVEALSSASGDVGGTTAAATQSAPVGAGYETLIDEGAGVWSDFLNLLFSAEFGVIYTSPVFVFGSLALLLIVLLHYQNRLLTTVNLLTILAYLTLPIAVVLVWRTTASFYGFRYLYPIFPLALFGYALFIRCYLRSPRAGPRRVPQMLIDFLLLGLCVVALLSQVFYGSSAALALHPGVNVFGKWHHLGASGYLWGLADAVGSPSAWLQVAAHRMPGFIAAELLPALSIDLGQLGARFGISTEAVEVGLARYRDLPGRAVLQVLLAFAFNLLALLHFLRWGVPPVRPAVDAPPAPGQVAGRE